MVPVSSPEEPGAAWKPTTTAEAFVRGSRLSGKDVEHTAAGVVDSKRFYGALFKPSVGRFGSLDCDTSAGTIGQA